MSLNKTLDRLFDEIRREARRNPDFADRLDAVLRLHASRREVSEEAVAEVAQEEAPPSRKRGKAAPVAPSAPQPPEDVAPPVGPLPNPLGLFKREGEEALRMALEGQELSALRALVAEHNLDPGGVTPALTRDELAAHILSQAKKRAERDEKMFDY
jgi:hypothetical protein